MTIPSDNYSIVKLAIAALTEAEAILGGEYGDSYSHLCNTMIDLRAKLAAVPELQHRTGGPSDAFEPDRIGAVAIARQAAVNAAPAEGQTHYKRVMDSRANGVDYTVALEVARRTDELERELAISEERRKNSDELRERLAAGLEKAERELAEVKRDYEKMFSVSEEYAKRLCDLQAPVSATQPFHTDASHSRPQEGDPVSTTGNTPK